MVGGQAEGLRVLVTAGGAGIGRAVTAALVAAGAKVHVCDISEGVLADCRLAMPDVGTTLADVSDEVAVDRLLMRFGRGSADSMSWSTTPASRGRPVPSRTSRWRTGAAASTST